MSLSQLVLVSQTPRLQRSELDRVAHALQRQLTEDLPQAWGLTASIQAVDNVRDTPVGAAPIIIREQNGDFTADLFGFHKVLQNDPTRTDDDQPFALVRYQPGVWSFDASHEVLEMAIDPEGNSMQRGLSLEGDREVDYLVEVCDPCGRSSSAYYFIDGVMVCDFVTRAYFDPAPAPGRYYTAQDRLKRPRTLQAGGYVAYSEMATSGRLGEGDWYMSIAGGPSRHPIPHPNAFTVGLASQRQIVDRESFAFVGKQARSPEERRSFRLALQHARRQHRQAASLGSRSARAITGHLNFLSHRGTARTNILFSK